MNEKIIGISGIKIEGWPLWVTSGFLYRKLVGRRIEIVLWLFYEINITDFKQLEFAS